MFSIFYAVILKHHMGLIVLLVAIFTEIFLSGELSRATSPALEWTGAPLEWSEAEPGGLCCGTTCRLLLPG